MAKTQPQEQAQTVGRAVRDNPNLNGRVAEAAYALFEKRGFQHGRDVEDWTEAERIVIGELQESRQGSK
jgi:hypothetical protein